MSGRLDINDKLAIHELLSRAAYGLDERKLDILSACFADDAAMTLRIGDGDTVGPFEGREGIMKLMTDSMAEQTDQRRHVVSNIFFESESEASATVISNLTLMATEAGQIQLLTAGVYRDEVVKQGAEWKLQRRHLDLDKAY